MIGVSRHTAETGRRWIYPHAPTEVVRYPMPWPEGRFDADPADRAALRAGLGVPDEDTAVILQASRLEGWKGHDLLLEALGRIADKH